MEKQLNFSGEHEFVKCRICLDFLRDPVTLLCGHNYCMDCINGCWDQGDQKGVYSCPQCRRTFPSRPVLNKNDVFAEVVDKIRKTSIQAEVHDHCHAGFGDVECDSCSGRKRKAVKSCLVCLVSYCETHLQLHDELFSGKRHNVVDATGQLEERICHQHNKLLEIFCRTDQTCVCLCCLIDNHKGHDTVAAGAERGEKEEQLENTQKELEESIQGREKEVHTLRKALDTLKSSAQTAVQESERMFTEVMRSIERRRCGVAELIRAQEWAEVRRAEGLLKTLEQEIAELKRRYAELEDLSQTQDHIHFLQTFNSIRDPPQPKDFFSIQVNPSISLEAVRKSISALKEELQTFLNWEIQEMSAPGLLHIYIPTVLRI
ncbi:hypothetical protein ACEWY4_006181 [Coilia grayii]|uniref:E3 ubiquitin/ISG15 ligase TRIM25-like n=1 Tax=Coilia grayii TaxID=363190 RepID=A0ABD1KCR1_9TELE